jgi:HEAT repeat protein
MTRKQLLVCLLITAGPLLSLAPAAPTDPNAPDIKHYQQAYDLILEQNWDQAFEAFSAFIQQYQQSPYFDDAHFWHCYALEKKGVPGEEVFTCYQSFIQAHPKSKWADDAQRNLIAIGTKLTEQGKTEYGDIIRTMQDSQETDVALAAVRALRNVDSEKALDALFDLYRRTGHNAIRKEIIFALSESRSPKALAKLVEIAQATAEPHMRKEAIFWLSQKSSSKETIQLLETIALEDLHRDVRERAAFALAEMKEGRGTEALGRIAQKAKDTHTRKKAIFWLGQEARSDEAIAFLKDIAEKDADADIAKGAVFALGEAPGGRGLKALRSIVETMKNPQVRQEAIFWLGQKDRSDETIQLLETIAQNDTEERVRDRAVFALSEMPKGRGIDALQRIAEKNSSVKIRERAVFWLGQKARTEAVIQYLARTALKDASQKVREQALLALAEAPEGRGVEALQRIGQTSDDPATRKKAIFWLGQKARSDEVFAFLGTCLRNDPDPQVRQEALMALAHAPDNKGVPALIEIAKSHPDKAMRKKAIFWLGESKDPRARQAILDIVSDVK